MRKLLLLVPIVLALAVPLYNFDEPKLFGFPFFYWCQIVLIPVASLFIFVVYRADSRVR